MSKEFLWFNPRLLALPINDCPELQWHRSWYKLTSMNNCLVDTTGISKEFGNGIQIKNVVEDTLGFSMHRNLQNGEFWHNNFDELMAKLSNRIFDRLEEFDELRLSYSGGTDSALALAALWSNPRINDWISRGKFVIHTTPHAKKEDPLIWNRIVDANIPLKFLDYDLLGLDNSNAMMVSGEGDGYCVWFKVMSKSFTDSEIFQTPLQDLRPRIEEWFLSGDQTGITWEFFNKLIQSSEQEITTLFQAWSLFEGACTQQCYLFRVSAYSNGPVRIAPRNNWVWFMADPDFWDMCAYEAQNKIYTSDDTLKFKPLRYIADWMGWSEIRTKKKLSSQILIPKLLRKSQILSDMTYTDEVDLCN